jgi:hypothetical protein
MRSRLHRCAHCSPEKGRPAWKEALGRRRIVTACRR